MITRKPLFGGDTGTSTMESILSLTGYPSGLALATYEKLIDWKPMNFGTITQQSTYPTRFPNFNTELLEMFLNLDPDSRITCAAALGHALFQDTSNLDPAR
jgi:hypothetical protein